MALALQVSQMSIRDLDTVFMKGGGFDEEFVKGAIKELLEALDFLHREVQAVHTGTIILSASSRQAAAHNIQHIRSDAKLKYTRS